MAQCRQSVVMSGREFVFGRQAIVDAQHNGARFQGQQPHDPVVSLEAAQNPAAAMEVDQSRQQSGLRGPIKAAGDGAARTGNTERLDGRKGRLDRIPIGTLAIIGSAQRGDIVGIGGRSGGIELPAFSHRERHLRIPLRPDVGLTHRVPAAPLSSARLASTPSSQSVFISGTEEIRRSV